MEELGFRYFENDDDSEELEERNARAENQRQRDLVAYFENKKKLSKSIATTPNNNVDIIPTIKAICPWFSIDSLNCLSVAKRNPII